MDPPSHHRCSTEPTQLGTRAFTEPVFFAPLFAVLASRSCQCCMLPFCVGKAAPTCYMSFACFHLVRRCGRLRAGDLMSALSRTDGYRPMRLALDDLR